MNNNLLWNLLTIVLSSTVSFIVGIAYYYYNKKKLAKEQMWNRLKND